MKIPNLFRNEIDESEKENFEIGLFIDNIHRGKILAVVIIGFEAVLLLIDIISAILKVDSRFAFDTYFFMYSILIIINVIYLLIFRNIDIKEKISVNQKKKIEFAVVIYIIFVMSWGSVISLLDQKLYGQLMAFMVNMIVCSVIYLLDNRKIIIPYIISVLILVIGLPYFQFSKDVLIGHYVNLIIFIIISWVTSRIIYHNYCENYIRKILLNKSNLLLEKEIEENKIINKKLTIANNQLKQLTLLDELTGIPNRRSFREFVDRSFQYYLKNRSTISVIMIDIDFFKQYNDYYGHEEGDKILIAVANQINSVGEESDEFVVRWGGEEFIYAAFNKTKEEIEKTAKTISNKVYDLHIIHKDSSIDSYITVSLGICTIDINDKKDIGRAVKLADKALYQAKSSGRNCIKTVNDDIVG